MIATQNWKQLSSIQIGGAVCLPVIVIGQTLSQTYGFLSAVLAIVLGNALLTLIALVMASMSFQEKKTTIENASLYFGKKGGVLFAWAMLFSLLGWFGIQLNLMSQALLDLLSIPSDSSALIAANAGLGLVMTCTGMYGLRALNLLSDFSMPILGITLLYALCMPGKESHEFSFIFTWGGLSLVMATAMAAVIDLPTFFRHARSKKDAFISIFLTFGVVIPLVELIGVYLAATRGGESVMEILKGNNIFWNAWVALFIILAGWTTNNTNLYSGAVSLKFIFPNISNAFCTWIVGLAGTFLACFNLLDHLEVLLGLLGVGIGSMGAVIIAAYLAAQCQGGQIKGSQRGNLWAWSLGAVLGIVSMCGGYSITSIAILDAFLAASFGTILFLIIKQRNFYETNPIR